MNMVCGCLGLLGGGGLDWTVGIRSSAVRLAFAGGAVLISSSAGLLRLLGPAFLSDPPRLGEFWFWSTSALRLCGV